MGVYDQSGRLALQSSHRQVVNRISRQVQTQRLGPDDLINFPAPWTLLRWADSRTAVSPGLGDRTSDSVSVMQLIGDLVLWLWIWEIQAQIDQGKLDVLFEEMGRLRCRSRYGPNDNLRYKVMPVLVAMKGASNSYLPQLDMTWEGVGNHCRYLIWIVPEDDARAALAEIEDDPNEWPMLFWIPLMAGADNYDVVQWWSRLWDRVEKNSDREDLIAVARTFAELAGRSLFWETISKEKIMTESAVVNGYIREAVEQTRLENARENLIKLLQKKFKASLNNQTIEAINNQPILDILNDWWNKAWDAKTWSQFIKSLRQTK